MAAVSAQNTHLAATLRAIPMWGTTGTVASGASQRRVRYSTIALGALANVGYGDRIIPRRIA